MADEHTGSVSDDSASGALTGIAAKFASTRLLVAALPPLVAALGNVSDLKFCAVCAVAVVYILANTWRASR